MRQTWVDEDGVGGGVVDHTRCRGFVNNSRPIDTRTQQQKRDEEPLPNFTNLKTQCAFKLAEIVQQSKINIQELPEQYQDEIIRELDHLAEIDLDKDGKKKITSKKELKENL